MCKAFSQQKRCYSMQSCLFWWAHNLHFLMQLINSDTGLSDKGLSLSFFLSVSLSLFLSLSLTHSLSLSLSLSVFPIRKRLLAKLTCTHWKKLCLLSRNLLLHFYWFACHKFIRQEAIWTYMWNNDKKYWSRNQVLRWRIRHFFKCTTLQHLVRL